MLDPRNRDERRQSNDKWKVFVLLKRNKQGLVLKKNTEVLYQVLIRLVPKRIQKSNLCGERIFGRTLGI